MKKFLFVFFLAFVSICSFAQERLYVDKEHGGAENGVVGKIADDIHVTGMGQLSYEIPILVPEGTGGMKPNLTIAYSSSTKEGLFGYGFDLSGLSIISRTPSNLFYDGKATAVKFKSVSNFSLDGQRLISCGDGEYRTANNTFSKVILHGTTVNPSAFTVYTKSGLIYEYKPLSTALGREENDSTLFWLVTKVIAVSVVTAGTASGPTVAVLAGAAGGAAGALTGSLLNGANIGQIAKTTFTGAFWGAASGYLNCISADEDLVASLFKHSFTQGGMDALQGGNMLHGFMMGAISSSGGYLINENAKSLGRIGEVAANSILSGTVEEIGGGKFANGAITGAFAILFNDMMHKRHIWHRNLTKIFDKYKSMADMFEGRSLEFYEYLGGPLGEWASKSPEMFGNTCAAKLSYALNYSGYKIKPHTPNTYLAGDGKWYFVNAKAMSAYLMKNFVYRNTSINIKHVINAITFQTGFRYGVSGHLDVFCNRKSASGHVYDDYPAIMFGK